MTKTTQYKNTAIGLIPTDWEVKKLGDIFKLTSGKTKPSNLYENKNIFKQYPVYGGNGIIGYSEEYNCSNEIIVIGRVGENCGVTRFINEKCWITDNALYTKDFLCNINIEFLAMKLQFIDLSKLRSKGGQPLISQIPIHSFVTSLPPLPEQQKIAEILSTWNKAIQETDAIIKKLEDRNKALANKLFEENNWQINKLSDLFERITDKNKEGNTTVTTISAKHGFIRQEDFFNKTVASKDLSNYYLINKGDFCYNKSYSKDYDWGVVKRLNDFEKAVVTTLYICFRFKDNSQNSDFWELYFENKILDKGLSKVAQEGGRAHGLLNVTSGDFFGIKVKVPSLEEQNAIAEILNTANQEVKQYQQKLQALKLQKKGLMQQLLTGKVRTV
mgnify:CR=1 FL=1